MRIHLEPGNFITFTVGLLILASGVYGYFHIGSFLDVAKETSGVVVEVTHESTNKKGRIHPVVRFTTANGKEVVVHSKEHHNVEAGQTVTLIYKPDDPSDIEITTLSSANKRRMLFTTLSLVLGLGVCGLGLGYDVEGPAPRPS